MSAMDVVWIVPVMIFMLLLKGFFSGSEIALVNADKLKLSHKARQGSRGAHLVVRAFQRPERVLTTTLIGTNISTVLFTTLGTLVMIHFLGDELGDLYAFLIFTPLLLIVGEIVPKSIFQQKSEAIAPLVIYPLRAFGWLLSPIVLIFSVVARIAAWMAGGSGSSQRLFTKREQLHALMDMAERGASTTVFDRFRIERAIRFPDATVGQEMIPVSQMVTIDSDTTTADATLLVRRRGFNRLPVIQGASNDVVGIATFNTWDLMDPDLVKKPLSDLTRPAHFVSPHDSLEGLLPMLQERDDQMAIVVDEYGSTIGMITMEDVVETVVGTIDMGYEFEEYVPRKARNYEQLADGAYSMDGRLPVHEVNDVLGIDLPTTEYHTIGGMMVARLRHLAKAGESLVARGYRFTVEEATETTVKKVRVERKK